MKDEEQSLTADSYNTLLSEFRKIKEELDMLSNTILGGVARLAVDDDLLVLTASEGYYRMTGYTEAELLQQPLFKRAINLVIPDDLPIAMAALEELIQRNAPVSVSYRIRKKDGSISWNTAYCAKIETTEQGRTMDVFFMDTTAVRNTEVQLSSLINSIPGGVIRARIGDDIHIYYANDEFYRQIGYSKEDFTGEQIDNRYLRVIHPEDRETLLQKALHFIESSVQCPSCDYRIITAKGNIRWMRVNASRLNDHLESENMIQCVITDITEECVRKRKNMMNEERCRIISEHTRDTVYEWDAVADSVQFSPIFEKMFGYPPPYFTPADHALSSDLIHEENKPSLVQMMENCMAGIPYVEGEQRFKKSDGTYLWCRHRVTTIFDEDHKPIGTIGLITDIEDYVQTTSILREKSMRDSLTGLLNRMSVEQQMEQMLLDSQPGNLHAFLQFDIDHFKQINDFMGHSGGDKLLLHIASLLKTRIRRTDIIGRMGGDEFAVLLTNVSSVEAACQKAEQLRESLHGDFKMDEKIYPLSSSIGMSIFPNHAYKFQELCQYADDALYEAKSSGGNRFVLYTPDEY